MPNTKISALTAGNPAQGTDEIPIARGAANFKVTAASIAALSPAGTVTSVGLSGGTTGLTVSGTNPITASGTFTLAGTLAPANGGTGAIGTPTNGQLLIGNGTNYSVANLTAGSNITITNSAGGITIAASGGGGVTTFSAGTTGFTPSTATSGAITLAGTLALANGGTGATTKAAAFNALSPVSATGDLIIGNGFNSNTRLAIGSFNQYLRSNGTTASWANVSVSASDIAGTLQPYQGGTGTSTGPTSNGQLLIGNGFGGYNVNTLTAGTGVTITNGSGTITIAASGGGGPTINIMSVSTSMGSFNNSPPSSSTSKPLAASATSPSYGAFVFANGSSGYTISSATISTIGIQDSTSTFTSFNSGPDFSGSPSSFVVDDKIVSCYGLLISNTSMLALFTNTRAAMTNPNLAPFAATFSTSSDNPNINVSTSAGTFFKNSNGGIVVDKNTPNYIIYFGTGSPTGTGSVTVSSMSIEAGGTSTFPTTYFDGSDFFTLFAENTASGMFQMQISVSNPTLQTLLDNSFRA